MDEIQLLALNVTNYRNYNKIVGSQSNNHKRLFIKWAITQTLSHKFWNACFIPFRERFGSLMNPLIWLFMILEFAYYNVEQIKLFAHFLIVFLNEF